MSDLKLGPEADADILMAALVDYANTVKHEYQAGLHVTDAEVTISNVVTMIQYIYNKIKD